MSAADLELAQKERLGILASNIGLLIAEAELVLPGDIEVYHHPGSSVVRVKLITETEG